MSKLLRPFRNLFSKRPPTEEPAPLPADLSYEEARAVLEAPDTASHLALAARNDIRPEILYYLATNPSADVRREVARNPATPHQSDCLLVTDDAEDVRAELARKITRLLPDIGDQERKSLRDGMIELLHRLAEDQLPRIREIIAEELKSSMALPADLARRLAADPVLAVCAPMLEFSPLLSDDDLKEIIAFTQVKGALTAIARRAAVSADVAYGIATALDVPAVAALLANPNADIREDTLTFIIDHAAAIQDWHGLLVQRPNLSVRLMRRIATFVASSLIDVMVRTQDLAPDEAENLLDLVRKRIKTDPVGSEDLAVVRDQVIQLHARGTLDEKFIIEAIDTQRRPVLLQALALMSDLSLADVGHILEGRNARRIVALTWRAGCPCVPPSAYRRRWLMSPICS